MRRITAWFKRLGGWWGREGRERALQDELAANIQMNVDDNLRAGMSLAEARRQAALKFGSVDSAKEAVRSQWTLGGLEVTRQDIVYALRGFRRNPGFALTAVISLALGIAASVAIFTVADSVLLRPLPYRDPGRLVMVWETNPHRVGAIHNVISPGNFQDWRAQSHAFEHMALFTYGRLVLSDGRRAEEFTSEFVSPGLPAMLGVHPWRGRLFSGANPLPQRPDEVLISYRLWQSWFGGDESVLGRKIQLSNEPATVIGILPPGFYFKNREADLWESFDLDPARNYRATSGRYLLSVARLKPGITLAQAQAEMSVIARGLEAVDPAFDKGWGVNLEPLRDSMVRDVRQPLLVLLGAALFVLAVACANVANLLLARHGSRRREMAVRAAIGAGWWRIARQLLTESLLLGLSGGLAGVLLANWLVSGLMKLAPQDLARNASVTLDLRVLCFAVALSLVSSVSFGLLPAWIAARRDALGGLREDGRGAIGRLRAGRRWLVAAEVAVSVMLLAGAGLMLRSLTGLLNVDPGLNANRVLTARVTLPRAQYRESAARLQFFARALQDLRALPGVQSAAAIDFLPFYGLAAGTGVTIGGRPPARPGETLGTVVRTVSPGYFHTMGIPLKGGRDFSEFDSTPNSPCRFVVNESFARKYLSGEQVLGKTISVDMADKNPFGEIIGIAGDVREGSVDREPEATVYYPHSLYMPRSEMNLLVRTAGNPMLLVEPVRRVIHEIDPAQPVADFAPMETIVRETFSRQKFSAVLLAGFSLVSLLLAAVGIYGVLAYSVTERTREFGVRMALGAEPSRIVALVLAGGARMLLAGTVAGIAGALALTSFLRTLLFGIGTHDPVTFIAVPLVLAAVGMIAAWLPAHRASRLPAVEALRAE
ncbi:MAG TPA: ABC transporter permease [Candidatus Acidoferrales bacterium]|nr:ABC transporter permease [Candidatus Acidoferrales bacterium]